MYSPLGLHVITNQLCFETAAGGLEDEDSSEGAHGRFVMERIHGEVIAGQAKIFSRSFLTQRSHSGSRPEEI